MVLVCLRRWSSAFVLVGGAVLCAAAGVAHAGPVYTDPETAEKESAAFRLQGEYAGRFEDGRGRTNKVGLQVVAERSDRFRMVAFKSGLPGEGAERNEDEARAKADGQRIVFKHPEDDEHAIVTGGRAKLFHDDQLLVTIRKIHRQSPTLGKNPPEGATALFDGTKKSLQHWAKAEMTDDGLLKEGAKTKEDYHAFTLHLEFRVPFKPTASNQSRGNSGVYLQNRYEVQVLDSFGMKPKSNWCGGLYKFKAPDVNMCYPPLSWQTYDIDFTGPTFNGDGKKTKNARITVRHNGVVIHDGVELPHGTGAGKGRGEVEAGPIILQDHGNPVRFRNVWIKPR